MVVDYQLVDRARLPGESTISAITLAELGAGPHATDDPEERVRRQDRLQWATSMWNPLPFDDNAARAYARVFVAVRQLGRSHRSRMPDMLIAATALANELPLYTRNPSDFVGLEDVVTIVAI